MNTEMHPQQPCSTATPFAAFLPLDWADQKHAWALQAADSTRIEQGEISSTPEAVEAWAAALAARFAGRPITVALEQSRGALVFMIAKYAHLVLYLVHGASLARYRRAFSPSDAKDDPSDAGLLLDLLQHHRDRLRRLEPDSVETRTLQFLVEERRKLVDEKTRQSNRLTAALKQYFPQILDWFPEVDSPLVGALLRRWPMLDQLRGEPPASLRQFFQQHNCRSAERIEQRLEQIQQAIPATRDAAVLEAGATAASVLVELLATLREGIAKLDQRIAALFAAHPDFAIFDSLPGAGPALAPRLLVALGSRRERYASAGEIQCYSGIAPVIERSGTARWVHFRWACPKFLRQTFHEWASHSIGSCPWARAYYQAQRAKGKGHHAAVRALAFKWIRILYRCWKDRAPYNESLYRDSVRRRACPKPIRASTPLATKGLAIAWESCGQMRLPRARFPQKHHRLGLRKVSSLCQLMNPRRRNLRALGEVELHESLYPRQLGFLDPAGNRPALPFFQLRRQQCLQVPHRPVLLFGRLLGQPRKLRTYRRQIQGPAVLPHRLFPQSSRRAHWPTSARLSRPSYSAKLGSGRS